MATFKVQVENYVGTFSNTTALDNWLTNAARIISDKLPLDKLEKHATDQAIVSGGLSMQGKKVFNVHKSGNRSIKRDVGLKAAIVDSGSIYYALDSSPAHIYDNGKLYLYAGGTATDGTALAYSYPTVANTDEAVTGFPVEYEHGLIAYAALNAQLANILSKNDEINSLTLTDVTPPSAPLAPSFSWTNTSYTNATSSSASWTDALIDTITSTTIDISGLTPPLYSMPTTTADFTDLETYIATEEDLEKADSEIQNQRARLENFQMANLIYLICILILLMK